VVGAERPALSTTPRRLAKVLLEEWKKCQAVCRWGNAEVKAPCDAAFKLGRLLIEGRFKESGEATPFTLPATVGDLWRNERT